MGGHIYTNIINKKYENSQNMEKVGNFPGAFLLHSLEVLSIYFSSQV